MVAAALGQNVSDLWDVYRELFDTMDLSNPDVYSTMWDLIVEMEENLTYVLNEVSLQAYEMTGVYEPLPDVEVEDFESSVLRSIGGLGTVDLDSYRLELE
jgi:hypothetical protein